MTKREEELMKEITILRRKLEVSSHWMSRQVEESIQSIGSTARPFMGFFERIKKFLNSFRHKPTLFEIWKKRVEAFMIGSGIILFWRGIWDLADIFLFPSNLLLSSLASLVIGLGILILSKNFVMQFLDDAIEQAD